MTTVVITSTEAAWDSLEIFGSERALSVTDKVRVIRPGCVLAFAGNSDDESLLHRWLEGGGAREDYPKFAKKSEFDAVVISRDPVTGVPIFTLYSYELHSGVRVSAPLCLGTGGPYAKGALGQQKLQGSPESALDAVRVAETIDTNTGGPLKRSSLDDLLGPWVPPRKRRRREKT